MMKLVSPGKSLCLSLQDNKIIAAMDSVRPWSHYVQRGSDGEGEEVCLTHFPFYLRSRSFQETQGRLT